MPANVNSSELLYSHPSIQDRAQHAGVGPEASKVDSRYGIYCIEHAMYLETFTM